ncbi:MAG TPA: hypothetical protein VIN93_02945 [Bryobacteraceae bacterium]
MRVACGFFAVAWAAFSLVGPLVNGNFATGDLTAWNTLGSASVLGAQGNIVPPSGSYQAQIGSGKDSGDPVGGVVTAFGFARPGSGHRSAHAAQSKSAVPNHPGNPTPNDPNFADVPVATLETTLHLPVGAIAAALPNDYVPTNGSAIYQTFAGTAGTALSFNWNFATNEKIPTQYDAALYSLQVGSNQAQVFELADTTEASLVNLAAGAASSFATMTGYRTTSVILPSTGTYTIGFISMQTQDDAIASATYINNVQAGGSIPSGPAPAAWSLGLLGLGFIAIYSGVRRLRRAI